MIEIRHFLTDIIGGGGLDETLDQHLRAIRAACRQFAHRLNPNAEAEMLMTPERWRSRHVMGLHDYELNQALGELRGVIGLHVGAMAAAYGIDLEEDTLGRILPAEDA